MTREGGAATELGTLDTVLLPGSETLELAGTDHVAAVVVLT